MHRGHKTIVIATTLFALLAFTHVPAFAIGGIIITDRYASPTGSGSTCSEGSPCTIQGAINAAQPGDTVLLKDGNYVSSANDVATVRDGTASAPITIKAQNRHNAVLKPAPDGSGSRRVILINRSHIRVRGIVIDGGWTGGSSMDGCCHGLIRVSPGNNTTATSLIGIIIEDNILKNSGGGSGVAVHLQGTDGAIIRWNRFERHVGSVLYVAEQSGATRNINMEVYANTILDTCGGRAFNIKTNNQNLHFHHNILDGMGALANSTGICAANNIDSVGAIQWGCSSSNQAGGIPSGCRVSDTIVRRARAVSWGGSVVLVTNTSTGRFDHSVVRDTMSPGKAVSTASITSANFSVDNNTWCNLSSSTRDTVSGLSYSNNNGLPAPNAPASACDAEEARILKERDFLPGNPTPKTHTVAPIAPTGLQIIDP